MAELVLMLLALLFLALALLAWALRALLLMLLTLELLTLELLLVLAQTPQAFLVSLLPLEVFAACFESAVALGLS